MTDGSFADMVTMLDRARVIADEMLFPAALAVDADGAIPVGHLDRLADEGFYGLAGRAEDGGDETDFASFVRIVEVLAGGCLTTTFTWIQHHSVVRGLTATPNVKLRENYLGAAIQGELRGGVAFAGAIPRPPLLWATPSDGGWLVRGESPFVTGWDIVDVLLISARDAAGGPEGSIVSGLVPAAAGGGITAEELQLIAVQGSNTVRLRFEDFFLPADRVVTVVSHTDFLAQQHRSVRFNGSLAMGVADRCIRLIVQADRPELAQRLGARHRAIRDRLDDGMRDPDALPAARAAASALAHQAAGALVVAVGSSGILAHRDAARLVREAAFTLAAASRPEIKDDLLDLFGR